MQPANASRSSRPSCCTVASIATPAASSTCSAQRHGRLTLFARGARGPKSKLASLLMPFRPLLVSWSGRGDAAQLTGRGAARRSADVAAAPGALGLLSQRAHHQSHHAPRSAAAAVRGLCRRRCAACASMPRPSRRCACSRSGCWRTIGYGLEFDVEPNGFYQFRAARAWPRCAKSARRLFGPLPAGAAARKSLDDAESLDVARRVLRQALDHCLEGRELRTRTVARSMARRGNA